MSRCRRSSARAHAGRARPRSRVWSRRGPAPPWWSVRAGRPSRTLVRRPGPGVERRGARSWCRTERRPSPPDGALLSRGEMVAAAERDGGTFASASRRRRALSATRAVRGRLRDGPEVRAGPGCGRSCCDARPGQPAATAPRSPRRRERCGRPGVGRPAWPVLTGRRHASGRVDLGSPTGWRTDVAELDLSADRGGRAGGAVNPRRLGTLLLLAGPNRNAPTGPGAPPSADARRSVRPAHPTPRTVSAGATCAPPLPARRTGDGHDAAAHRAGNTCAATVRSAGRCATSRRRPGQPRTGRRWSAAEGSLVGALLALDLRRPRRRAGRPARRGQPRTAGRPSAAWSLLRHGRRAPRPSRRRAARLEPVAASRRWRSSRARRLLSAAGSRSWPLSDATRRAGPTRRSRQERVISRPSSARRPSGRSGRRSGAHPVRQRHGRTRAGLGRRREAFADQVCGAARRSRSPRRPVVAKATLYRVHFPDEGTRSPRRPRGGAYGLERCRDPAARPGAGGALRRAGADPRRRRTGGDRPETLTAAPRRRRRAVGGADARRAPPSGGRRGAGWPRGGCSAWSCDPAG